MRQEKGFVLLDAIVGVLILSMGITTLFHLSIGARRALYLSQWKAKAINLAQTELEEIKSMGVDQALAAGRMAPGQTVETRLENGMRLEVFSSWAAGSENLLEVRLSSSWSLGPDPGSVELATFLSRR